MLYTRLLPVCDILLVGVEVVHVFCSGREYVGIFLMLLDDRLSDFVSRYQRWYPYQGDSFCTQRFEMASPTQGFAPGRVM